MRTFDEIESMQTDWLLDRRIPIGEVTLIAGMPGAGKTLWLCNLAALVSRGEFVNGEPSFVLFATAEDAEDKTLKPRLVAAGAEMANVGLLEARHIDGDEDSLAGSFRLPSDTNLLAEIVEERRPKLLLIDPLMAHIDAEINSWKDESARQAMTPLTMLAQEYDMAVVCALHLNKRNDEDALVRVGGSLGGIVGPARSAFLWGADTEDDESQRLLVHIKHNLTERQPTQVYRIESTSIAFDRGGFDEVGRVVLTDETTRGAEAVLAGGSKSDANAVDAATEFLEQELSDGPVAASEVQAHAKQNGISHYGLNAAKKRLGVVVEKQGYTGGKWIWSLPQPLTVHVKQRKTSEEVAACSRLRRSSTTSTPSTAKRQR